MLTIHLSPVRSNSEPLVLSIVAPVLTVNGINYDLSELPDGATATHPVLGTISRVGDDVELTLVLPHGPDAPYSTRFPEDIIVNTDGPIKVPSWGKEEI